MSTLTLASKYGPAGSLVLSARSATGTLRLAARSVAAPLVTHFTINPVGRIFNARFSDRFKKS